jgi:hypothetical protein
VERCYLLYSFERYSRSATLHSTGGWWQQATNKRKCCNINLVVEGFVSVERSPPNLKCNVAFVIRLALKRAACSLVLLLLRSRQLAIVHTIPAHRLG